MESNDCSWVVEGSCARKSRLKPETPTCFNWLQPTPIRIDTFTLICKMSLRLEAHFILFCCYYIECWARLVILHYYSSLQTLDGGMYEKVAEYFSIMSRTELYTCSASQFSFGKIKEQAMTVLNYNLFSFVTQI